jgi:hypothetical protein
VGAVITDLLYLVISLILVGLVGRTLSRNSRAFLPERFGPDGMADAVSRVLVVAYYLLAAGFIALTMPTWSHVATPGQAMELLSGQVGILLLMLGGLHLGGTAVLARLRRGRPLLSPASRAATLAGRSVSARSGPAASGTADSATASTTTAGANTASTTTASATTAGAGTTGSAAAEPDAAVPAAPGSATGGSGAGDAAAGTAGTAADGAPADGATEPGGGRLSSTGLWRPNPRDVVH